MSKRSSRKPRKKTAKRRPNLYPAHAWEEYGYLEARQTGYDLDHFFRTGERLPLHSAEDPEWSKRADKWCRKWRKQGVG